MATFRLLRAHYLPDDKYLLGDLETEDRGEQKGTIVGDGTPHRIDWPTLDMEPLDDEARELLERERERLQIDAGTMNPVDNLPMTMTPTMDQYEKDYIPGSNQRRRPMRPHGAPMKVQA